MCKYAILFSFLVYFLTPLLDFISAANLKSAYVVAMFDAVILFCRFRKVWLTPVKIVSWRQRSGPPYRRLTTSPQMPQTLLILPDRMTSPTLSLSLTARVPFLSTVRIMKRQYRRKRRARAASTPLSFLLPPLSSACIRTVRLPPTENRRTKKTTTVTRRRRAKRTTWSPRLLVLFIQSLK